VETAVVIATHMLSEQVTVLGQIERARNIRSDRAARRRHSRQRQGLQDVTRLRCQAVRVVFARLLSAAHSGDVRIEKVSCCSTLFLPCHSSFMKPMQKYKVTSIVHKPRN